MDSTHLASAADARTHLQQQGWIARRSESFHHLPPPPLAQWLGPDDTEAPPASPDWALHIQGEGSAVQAHWLDALDPVQRRALFADLPPPGSGEAAPFAWAQRALCRQGLRLQVAASATPITLHLQHQGSDSAHAPLLVLDLAPGARCLLLETHSGNRGTQNLHQHIRLAEGAQLQHLRVCHPAADASVAHHLHTQVAAHARYTQALVATSARYHLQRQHIALRGTQASAHSSALLLAPDTQIDQQTSTDLQGTHTSSTVEALVLAQNRAHTVANAFTRIAPGSNEAQVRQRLCGVPISGNPRLILRPHLEILHDQVQAAHGATWGAMPEDALFYARQRGLDEASARALIIDGMARALLQRCLGDDENGLLGQWLASGWLNDTIATQLQAPHMPTEKTA